MSQFVGTWVYDGTNSKGDMVRVMRLAVTDKAGVGWGTAIGLGWTPILHVKKVGDSVLTALVTGAWEDATEAAALFSIGDETTMSFVSPATTLIPGAGVGPIDYEGLLVMDAPSSTDEGVIAADDQSETYGFRVMRWP